MCSTTSHPKPHDAEGQALLAKLKGGKAADGRPGRGLDHRGRQPRWLSFLNKAVPTSLWQVPFDFVNTAAPNGKLAPFLAKQNVQMYRVLAVGHHAVVLQHGRPFGGRLYARLGSAAPRDRQVD